MKCLSPQHNVSCFVSSTYSLSSFSQVGVSNQSTVGNLSSGDASNCNKMMPDELNKISSSTTMEGSLLSKTLDSKHGRKLKRKNLKYHLGSLHLSSNILFKASLSLCKKKKHRRRKRQSAGSKSLPEETLFSRDEMSGPSTSEKSKSIYSVSTCKSRKKAKHGSRESNGNSTRNEDHKVEWPTDIVDKEGRKRSTESSSVHANGNKLNCSSDSTIVANHNDSIEANCPKDGNRSANRDGLCHVRTNGFQNTVGKQFLLCCSYSSCYASGREVFYVIKG